MTITIAGEKKEYAEGTTIAQIIEAEKVENPLYVTVSLNDDFVEGLGVPEIKTVEDLKAYINEGLQREILLNFFISWEGEVSNGIY